MPLSELFTDGVPPPERDEDEDHLTVEQKGALIETYEAALQSASTPDMIKEILKDEILRLSPEISIYEGPRKSSEKSHSQISQ